MNKDAIRLLDRLYQDLYLDSQIIKYGTGNQYDKFDNIKAYIEKLEKVHGKISGAGKHIDFLKQLYYDKYVIKEENIPDSYYEHRKEIALERGYGYIELTERNKKELQEEIINNQKASIDIWIDYFLSEDAKVYPFWAKYWAFQGMLKLGTYDKEKGIFNKRTKETVAPFPDLNREALAISIDLMIKILNKEEIEDKELEVLVKSGSFGKIYAHVLNNVLKDNKNITKRNIGKWIKYDRGNDHMPLVNSLQGYNTGWCTAGESTAKLQLKDGDFYVYYTLDENEEYKVPRIAIRMEGNKIGEIRGIADNQNIESEMEEVVEEKIKDFPDKEEYYKKVNDMKELTRIYRKHKNNEELTEEELKFIYEIDEEIMGFGYGEDPRIEEIKKDSNKQISRLNFLFKQNAFYYKDLDLSGLTSAEGLIFPKTMIIGLNLSSLISIKGITFPEKMESYLYLSGLTSAEGLVLPKNVKWDLCLSGLTSAEGLVLPETIGGDLYLDGLISTKGLVLPKTIGGDLYLRNLISIDGLILPEKFTGNIMLNGFIISPKNIEQYRSQRTK